MSEYSGVGFIRFEGVPCVRSAEIDIDFDSKNTDVDELIAGNAGHSAGAKKYQITVTQSVPANGYEMDWFRLGEAQLQVQLDFVIPGVTDRSYTGDIRNVKAGTKVNQANTVNFVFHGRVVSA